MYDLFLKKNGKSRYSILVTFATGLLCKWATSHTLLQLRNFIPVSVFCLACSPDQRTYNPCCTTIKITQMTCRQVLFQFVCLQPRPQASQNITVTKHKRRNRLYLKGNLFTGAAYDCWGDKVAMSYSQFPRIGT